MRRHLQLRDLAQLIGPLVMITMFLGPVFYPREAMPAAAQPTRNRAAMVAAPTTCDDVFMTESPHVKEKESGKVPDQAPTSTVITVSSLSTTT